MDGLIELLGQIDPTATLIAVATIFAAIWLQAWIWSAAALAFLKHNDTTTKRATATRQVPAVPPTDLRARAKHGTIVPTSDFSLHRKFVLA